MAGQYDECLQIKFPKKVEYAGLRYTEGFKSVMEGDLFNGSGDQIVGGRVSVTRQDQTADVSCKKSKCNLNYNGSTVD